MIPRTNHLTAAAAAHTEGHEGIRALRRRYTMARVESMRYSSGLYLPDSLVNDVIDTWSGRVSQLATLTPLSGG